jgi:hypothetical protein
MHRARTLALVAAASLLAVPAVSAKEKHKPPVVKKDTTYKGLTDQGSVCTVEGVNNKPCTVTLKTSKDGKRLVYMLIRYGAACKDEAKYFRSSTLFTKVPITAARFEWSGTYGEDLVGGGHSENDVTLHGVFKRIDGKATVRGDFRVKNKLTFPDDKPTKCGSGKVAWSARPK